MKPRAKLTTPALRLRTSKSAVLTVWAGPDLLDRVLATCNYEASGDGVVLVDTDQLENTSDTNGHVEKIQKAIGDYDGLVVLRA
jgi:hypothetical protein